MTFVDNNPNPAQDGVLHPDSRQPPSYDGELGREVYLPDKPAKNPWGITNPFAVAVHQRSAMDWRGTTSYVGADAGAPGTEASKLVDRQQGRDWVLIANNLTGSVPILIGHSAGAVESGEGFLLPANSAITLYTEGAIWATVVSSGTGGPVSVATGINPVRDDI